MFWGQHGVVEHDGDDGMDPRLDVKTGIGHFFTEVFCVFFQFIPQFSCGRKTFQTTLILAATIAGATVFEKR